MAHSAESGTSNASFLGLTPREPEVETCPICKKYKRLNKPCEVCAKAGDASMPHKPRVSWDQYFMNIATQVATRATCDRKHVGAVIVKNKTILSTGYNGSPRGLPHCDEVGHELKDMGGRQSCVRTVHAEANAIAQAARAGTAVDGAYLYTTASPCYDCLKLLINAGIKKIVCLEFYDSRYGMSGDMKALASSAGVEMVFLGQEEP